MLDDRDEGLLGRLPLAGVHDEHGHVLAELERFADLVGVAYAPSALFLVALGFILLLLLHFSLVISRLADQTKVLAQRLGLVQNELDEVRAQLSAERERHSDREHIHS